LLDSLLQEISKFKGWNKLLSLKSDIKYELLYVESDLLLRSPGHEQ